MSESLLVERAGPLARLTLNRPEEGNRLTLPMMRVLAEEIARSARDPSVRVLLLAGRGPDFCLGRDPAGSRDGPPPSALEIREHTIGPILAVYEALRRAPVPVVAAVAGRAFGFGCALAGACDITIAAEGARFALPEMQGDLPPTLAISALIERVPPKALAYLVYSCAPVDATAAAGLGLVSRVVAAGALETETEELLGSMAQRSAAALATVKEYLLHARRLDPGAAADLAASMLATVLGSRR